MDELQAVRELFAEPAPPRPEVIAGARARVLGRTPLRRRIWLRAAVPAVAAAAAAAVVAAVAVWSPGGGAGVSQLPAGATGTGPGASAAARNILLTAARRVAGAATPPAGRYWQTRDVVANVVTVGPAGRHYLIVEKVAAQQWTARLAPGPTFSFVRALGVQFPSARDLRAWRLDGSPTTWNIDQEDSLADPHGLASGFGHDITAGRGKQMSMGVYSTGTGKSFGIGHTPLSARELQALPASPARLEALILRGSSTDPGAAESYLFQVTPSLLAMPVTPAVRAALYRMLAALPDVRSLGQVKDAAGHSGAAVALTGRFQRCGGYGQELSQGDRTGYRFSSCTVQQRLVIDLHTGLPLAQELRYLKLPPGQTWSAADGLFSYAIFGSARWTNLTPPTPGN